MNNVFVFVFNDIVILIFIVLFFSGLSNKIKKNIYAVACIPYLVVMVIWGFDLSFWIFQDVTMSLFSLSALVTTFIIGYLQGQVDESAHKCGEEAQKRNGQS